MNRQAAKQVIEYIENAIKDENEKAIRNAICFHPGCTERPIRSHVISKKFLRRIAKDSHVLTWSSSDASLSEMADALDMGKSLEHLNMIPALVGIGEREKVAYPLFCHLHDERIFLQIDNREIASHPERLPKQVLLLAYRALCSLAFQLASLSPIDTILEAAKKSGYQHSLSEPERYAKLHRFMAKDIMLSVYRRYEQIRKSGDYSQLGHAFYVMDVPPCIATTYSLIPIDDDEAKAITDGTLRLKPEDAINFTFLPHEPVTNSICVMSWLNESQRARRFMSLNKISDLSEKERLNTFFHFAFESPSIYLSPQWWTSLNGEKRMEYTKIHFNAAREHAELIWR